MDILIINPPRFQGKIPVVREDRCEVTDRYSVIPPYSLIWIAAILRKAGHNVNLIDANGINFSYNDVFRQIKNASPNAVIFRFTPTTFDWDMKTAQIIKTLYKSTFTIGICLTLATLQKEVMRKAPWVDFYIPDQWETVVERLINTLDTGASLSEVDGVCYRKNGDIIINNSAPLLKNYDLLPMPAYDLLPSFSFYRPNSPNNGNFMILYTSKGCPYSCIYCTVANSPFKIKSSKNVINELELLYYKFNVRHVSFFDETFTIARTRIIDLSSHISKKMPLLQWYCNTRVNLVDPELLIRMYRGGCRGIAYGIESGSQKVLNAVKKGITVTQARNAIMWTKKANIKVYVSFIIGLPGDNYHTIWETTDFLKHTLPNGAQFNIAVPYPGTVLFKSLSTQGLIPKVPNWNGLYQHSAVVGTSDLSPNELINIRKKLYRSLYFNPLWILENVSFIIRNPCDLSFAINYYCKSIKNYLLYGMVHSH